MNTTILHATHALFAALLFTTACGSSAEPSDATPASTAPLLDAAPDDALAASEASASPGASEDAPSTDAPTDSPDPCAPATSLAAHCAALVGTTPIADPDVTACIDAMSLVRADACFTTAQRAAFDETALKVLESALSLTPATCDSPHLQQSLQSIQRYVTTARGLSDPTEIVDHPKLVRLDDAFWRGVYWGDPRAPALDRATLRTIRFDALDCVHAVLDASFPALTAPQNYPLTTAPLTGIVGETMAVLGEAYDWTTVDHEVACAFASCSAPELPDARLTWPTIAVLDDGSAMSAAMLGAADSVVWGYSLAQLAANHAVYEASVLDALGATLYTPALLSDPSASDLPAFASIVATRDHARALVAAYAKDGTYTLGPANDLYLYAGMADYPTAVSNDLTAQLQTLSTASATAYDAENAFYAGTGASYDLKPVEAVQRAALVWTAAHVAPIALLRFPKALGTIDQSPELGTLLTVGDAPASYALLPSAIEATDAIAQALETECTQAPAARATPVALAFPNPSHVAVAGESPIYWRQADATTSKFVWDAIALGSKATVALQPPELYSPDGGAADLVCGESALVLRAAGILLEYAPSLLPPFAANGADSGFALAFTAPAEQPYLTAASQLLDFRTENIGTQAGVLPLVFANELDGLDAATPIFATSDAAGASPFASFQIDFAALKTAIGSDLTAPRSLTVVMNVDVAPLELGPLTPVPACTQ